MSYVSHGKTFRNGNSIYKITLLAAKRAVELNNGSQKLIETKSKKFSTIALEEIGEGKISYKMKEHKE
ncbi:DNA-directed RNA polymerase subunit omega [Candidatus Omnitrophota bacterium]